MYHDNWNIMIFEIYDVRQKMKHTLLVSTGTMVGRRNGYQYDRALGVIRSLMDEGLADGTELMMLPFYYDKLGRVADAVRMAGVNPAVVHCEKEIGTMLSEAGVLNADGRPDLAEARTVEAIRYFRLNCEMARALASRRMVLHLWGGMDSDAHVDYNISVLPRLNEIASEYGVRLLIENVPSNRGDPMTNWHKALPFLGGAGLIFDTRFGKLHEQSREILTDGALTEKIEHIHVSDFAGTYRDFKALRPILHPGEGSVDFDEIAALLDGIGYAGTVTLESPVMVESELDVPKLRRTMAYLRTLLG